MKFSAVKISMALGKTVVVFVPLLHGHFGSGKALEYGEHTGGL